MLIGGVACGAEGLLAASRIGVCTGARVFVETFPARLERGAGLPAFEQLAYFAEHAQAHLNGVKHLIVAGTASPVSFFAYPGKASDLVPGGAAVHVLAPPEEDVVAALTALAESVAPNAAPRLAEVARPALPSGRSPRRTGPTSWARCCRPERSSPTSPTPPASRCPRPRLARRNTPSSG